MKIGESLTFSIYILHPLVTNYFAEWFPFFIFLQKKTLEKSRVFRAIDGARTRGLDLGKVARYQLRHYRIFCCLFAPVCREQYVYYYNKNEMSTSFSNFFKNFSNLFFSGIGNVFHRNDTLCRELRILLLTCM